MEQYLYKYLLLNRKLSIAALGNFVIEEQPGYFNDSTGLLFPRRPVINFNEGPAVTSDKDLLGFLAKEMGVDETAAIKEFQNFSIKLLVSMVEQQHTDLVGIGRMKKDANGHILFTPASNLIEILPPLRVGEKIKLGKNVKEGKTVKEVKEVVKEVKEVVKEVKEVKELVKQPLTAKAPLPPVVERKETIASVSAPKGRAEEKVAAIVVEMSGLSVEEEMEEETIVQSRWWIYAAALALAGVGALLFHMF